MISELTGILSLNPIELGLAFVGLALIIGFLYYYLLKSITLARALRKFSAQLQKLDQSSSLVDVADTQLRHLWKEYCETLHEQGKIVDEDGLDSSGVNRATAPAAAFFNSGSVIDGRISVEFFKHLPGLLTGLGIIATFLGLIRGLDSATTSGNGLDLPVLIGSVHHAFIFSASAIFAAMAITFFEKWRYARLVYLLDRLCHQIDRRYNAGVGEEYLERLVTASEKALTNSQQIKDSVINELRDMLERLGERQIEASNRHSAELRASLHQPMEAVAKGITELGQSQSQAIGAGFQDQMAVFADRLNELLGSQVGRARDLQDETMRALERAAAQFDGLAQKVGSAGEAAAGAMSDHLKQALDRMAERQGQMTEAMRAFLDQSRENAGRSQADTQAHLNQLLQDLGGQMSAIMGGVQREALASGETARAHQQQISEEAQRTIQGLAGEVNKQTEAIQAATAAMRGAVADLGSSAARSLEVAGLSAEKMTVAAEQFSRSGAGLSEMFQRSGAVADHMTRIAETLASASSEIGKVVDDYKQARSEFTEIVGTLGETVATAKRDASMTAEIVSMIDASAEKLRHAQGQADAYLGKLNEVFGQAHESFRDQMINTVSSVNREFHDHLTASTSLLSGAIESLGDELDRMPGRTQ